MLFYFYKFCLTSFTIVHNNACKKLKGRKFDLIFADPPYKLDKIDDIPAAIFDNELLAENGIAIIEHPANTDFSSHPRFSEHRQYGSVNFSLFR